MYNRNRIPLKRRPVVIIENQPGEDQMAEMDNFLGLGKKARARKDKKFDVRMKKKEAKIEDRSYKKRVKADALAKRYSGKAEAGIIQAQGEADANMLLAQQGIIPAPVTPQPTFADKALNTVGSLLGQGDSTGVAQEQDEIYEEDLRPSQLGIKEKTETGKSNNTIMYIVIAVVVIAAFMFFKKKK